MTRRLLDIFAALSVLLFVAIIVLWARSYSVHDILGFAFAGGNGHAVHSVLGRLYLKTDLDGGYTGGLWHVADRVPGPRGLWDTDDRISGPGTRPDGLPVYELSRYDVQVRCWCGFSWKTYSCIVELVPGVGPFPTTHHRLVAAPHWFPAVVLGIASGLWVKGLRQRVRRRFRLTHGLCLACGYNLTGNVSSVCPECGMPVPRTAVAT